MGLSHLTTPTAQVEAPGGEFTVRGLSLDDIITIVGAHTGPLSALFTKIKMSGDGKFSLDDMTCMLTMLAVAAPEAAAQIIAVAANVRRYGDDGESLPMDLTSDMAMAASFPFPVQLDALEQIAKLTFTTAGSLKKVLETIIRVVKGTTDAMLMVRQI